MVEPISGPVPQTIWTRPAGRPASYNRLTPNATFSVDLLSGLSTTPLPAISAGIASDKLVAKGKFHGEISPTTPLGTRTSVEVEKSGTTPPCFLSLRIPGAALM